MEKENLYISEEFQIVLDEFLHSKKGKRTKVEYKNTLRLLCENIVHKDFLEITEQDAESIFHNMNEKVYDGSLTYKTVCYRLSVYNCVAKYIETNHPEMGFVNPFRNIERPVIQDKVSPAKIPTLSELDKILTVAKDNPMYYLILALTTRCGLTATNIVRLTKSNIFIENDKMGIYIPHPENEQKTLSILLPDDVKTLMGQYLESLGYEDEQKHIFYNKRGNAITLKNLSDNIGEIVRTADVEFHYTLKDMRTRAILDLVDAGADDETVQQYMGLGPMRTRQFFEAKGMAAGCPVELVNYSIKTL